jgi:predicted nuclease with TOPRIM domain
MASIEGLTAKIKDIEYELIRANAKLQNKEQEVESLKKDIAKLEEKKQVALAEAAKMQDALDKLVPPKGK